MFRQFLFAIVLFSYCVIQFAGNALAQKGEVVTWVDTTGKYKVQAEFLRMDGTNVVLLKGDGTETKVPMSKLNAESQNRAKEAAKAAAKAPPKKEPITEKPSEKTSNATSIATIETSGWDTIAIPAVTSFPSNASAQQFLDVITSELKKKNNLVFWDALPTKHQTDAQQLVVLASSKLDPKTFTAIRDTTQRVIKLLRTKKEYVLGSQHIRQMVGATDISTSYDPGVELIAAYLAPEIMSPDRIKQGNLRELLGRYFANIVSKADTFGKTLPVDSPIKGQLQGELPPDFSLSAKEVGQGFASLNIVSGGQTPPPISLVNVEGRWLPESMVQSWDQQIQFATQQLEAITPQKANEIHQGLVGTLNLLVNPQIMQLQNAKSQSEFDEYLETLVSMAKQQVGNAIPFPN